MTTTTATTTQRKLLAATRDLRVAGLVTQDYREELDSRILAGDVR